MAFIDYYKILGVDKNIPQQDVRAAYRKRAKQFHPDLHPNDVKAKAKFQALNEAYEVIGDPQKRAQYDKYGEQWKDVGGFSNSKDFGFNESSKDYSNPFANFDFSTFNTSRGGGFSSFFQDLFGSGRIKQENYSSSMFSESMAKPINGNIEQQVNIDLFTALLGGDVIIRLPNGRKAKLKIKEGTQNGTKVRLRGKGKNIGNGIIGDFIITYHIKLPENLTEHQKELFLRAKNEK
ncbi:DnaJ domain-containing protein [Prevotella amnii]|uniref:DnaJ domain-containing protein n=1 Tax=Prevotella amnii TaxID=419005 RepID=UPI003369C85D